MQPIPAELKEIAPNWYEHLTSDQSMFEFFKKDGVDFFLVNTVRCVVGEAYKFNESYNDPNAAEYCHDCSCYAIDIYNNYGDIATPISKFVKHFKEAHKSGK